MSGQYNHELKLERAREHLVSLDAEWQRWREGEPYSFVHEPDANTGEYVVRVHISEQPPAKFALIVGDCIHNIRSALDNLVYELAVAYLDIGPIPDGRARGLAFPVFGDRAMKEWECRNKIGCIDPRAQAVIKELQPYKRGEDFASDPLWMIHQLSNVDKHRLPYFQLILPAGGVFTAESLLFIRNVRSTFESGPVEHGAEMARYVRSAEVPDAELQMHYNPLLSIGFGDSLPIVKHRSAFILLPSLIDYVADTVVRLLTPYLTPH